MPQRFVVLDFLRFLFALMVFWGHAHGFISVPRAYLAVDYFFILSGFVLCHAYAKRLQREKFLSNFVKDRVARLYPLHLFVLIVLVFMNFWYTDLTGKFLEAPWAYKDGHAYTLVLHTFLVNNIGLASASSSWNSPAWSISVEMWVNIFIASIALLGVRRLFVACCIIAAGSFVLLITSPVGFGIFNANMHGFLNMGLTRGLCGMSIGVISYFIFAKANKLEFVSAYRVVFLIVAAFVVGLQVWVIAFDVDYKLSEFDVVPISAAAIVLIAICERQFKIGSAFVNSALERLGECSYSIYLIHWPVIVFINYFIMQAWHVFVDWKDPAVFFSITVGLIVLSWGSYKLIELPGKTFAKRIMGQPIKVKRSLDTISSTTEQQPVK